MNAYETIGGADVRWCAQRPLTTYPPEKEARLMADSDPNTVKLCECGCGQATRISTVNHSKSGYVRGKAIRFVNGHQFRKQNPSPYYLHKGHIKIHVLIAEKALGRPMPKGAEVHHVDGNIQNNHPSNLVICPNASYHKLLHVRQRVLALGGDPNTQRKCKTCHRLVFIVDLVGGCVGRNGNRCKKCNSARRLNSRKDNQLRRRVQIDGQFLSISEALSKYGNVSLSTLQSRRNSGWPLSMAMLIPRINPRMPERSLAHVISDHIEWKRRFGRRPR